jgi:chloramphenicol-sensitive protein RarD
MNKELKGIVLCMFAYTFWGISPFFWKLLTDVPSFELIAHRVLWSFIIVFFILKINSTKLIHHLKNRKLMLSIFICGFLIITNWSLYIYLVNTGYLLECSLGYYINPIISILLGVIFLKESLSKLEWIAAIIAFIGVLYKSIILNTIPIYALVLAFTFGLYGLVKKKTNLDAAESLFLETILFIPIIIGYMIYLQFNNNLLFLNSSLKQTILLICAGFVTFLPLYLFSKSTKFISLNKIGFIQFIVPTLFFIEGVLVFKEKFTHNDLIPFVLIWIGIGFYIYSNLNKYKITSNLLNKSEEIY